VLSLTKLIVLAFAGSFFLAVSGGYFKVIKASPENETSYKHDTPAFGGGRLKEQNRLIPQTTNRKTITLNVV